MQFTNGVNGVLMEGGMNKITIEAKSVFTIFTNVLTATVNIQEMCIRDSNNITII